MKAKEYIDKSKFSFPINGMELADIMEAYHQSEVNAISDDDIEAVCRLRWRDKLNRIVFKNAIKWFKNKLLNK